MPGPPASLQRRRRNAVPTAPGKTLEPVPEVLPEVVRATATLTPRRDGKPWHEATVALWDAIWQSPQAAEFSLLDVHTMMVLIEMHHTLFTMNVMSKDIDEDGNIYEYEDVSKRNAWTRLAAEIRQWQAKYGLTPLDKHQMRWTVAEAEKAEDDSRRRVTNRPPGLPTMRPSSN